MKATPVSPFASQKTTKKPSRFKSPFKDRTSSPPSSPKSSPIVSPTNAQQNEAANNRSKRGKFKQKKSSSSKYERMPVKYIRNRLAQHGQSTEGLKAELIDRLVSVESQLEEEQQDPAYQKHESDRRQEEADAAAKAAADARRKLEQKRDYNERLATTDALMQRIRAEVKDMPTKVIRAHLLNRGFDADGKRKEVLGRLARIMHKEKEEYERNKSVEEKREDELRKMRDRIKLQQQVSHRRKRAMHKVGIMARLKIGLSGAKAVAARAARAASSTKSSPKSKGLHFKGMQVSQEESRDLKKFVSDGPVPGWFAHARRKIKIHSLSPGDGVSRPRAGDIVLFHYTASIARDGTEIDNSFKRGIPESITLGADQALRCWEFAFTQMTVGEKIVLTSPPEYAYGSNGCPPIVVADTAMRFEIQLLRFQRPTEAEKQKDKKEVDKRTGQDVISHMGNDLYASNSFKGSMIDIKV